MEIGKADKVNHWVIKKIAEPLYQTRVLIFDQKMRFEQLERQQSQRKPPWWWCIKRIWSTMGEMSSVAVAC
jgi:hypothetical protein